MERPSFQRLAIGFSVMVGLRDLDNLAGSIPLGVLVQRIEMLVSGASAADERKPDFAAGDGFERTVGSHIEGLVCAVFMAAWSILFP